MSLTAAPKFALVNKTFPKEQEVLDAYKDTDLYRNLNYAISVNQEKRLPESERKHMLSQTRILSFNGPTGYGKTSATEYITKELIKDAEGNSLKVVSLYMPWVKMDRMQLVIPYLSEAEGIRRMRVVTAKSLLEADVIIMEESDRVADTQVKNFMMELIEGSLGGVKLREGLTIIHLNNPKGSSGVSGADKDLAQASRIRHIDLHMDDLPWTIGLAGTYPELDLTTFFDVVQGFPEEVRLQLPPRTMEHVLYAAGNGFPTQWGLPIISGKRDQIMFGGKNVTAKYLKAMVEAAGFSYIRNEGSNLSLVKRAISTIIGHGNNLFLSGPAGMGKSQFSNAAIRAAGAEPHLVQAPNTAASRHVMTLPSGQDNSVLETMISDKFNPKVNPGDKPLVMYLDEPGRARDDVKNILLEVCGPTRRLGDIPLPFQAIIATDNPGEVNGFRMSLAGTENRALAERFHLSVELNLDSLDPMDYLIQKYGGDIECFTDWWSNDLEERERLIANPRVLENMFDAYVFARAEHMNIDQTIDWIQKEFPVLGDERFGPSLNALRNRLQKIVVADIGLLVANVDEYERRAQGSKGHAEQEGVRVLLQTVMANTSLSTIIQKGKKPEDQDNLRAVLRIVRHVPSTTCRQIVAAATQTSGSAEGTNGKMIAPATFGVMLSLFNKTVQTLDDPAKQEEFLDFAVTRIAEGGRIPTRW